MHVFPLIAQIAAETNPYSLLVAYGPMGIMLAWFMLRSERAMNNLAHRIDGMTRAMLVDTLSRDNVGHNTRKHAEQQLAKIEARDAKN